MNIHEYQAKQLFKSHGVPVPGGGAATTEREARELIKEHGPDVVIKAQVHAGGRGKGRIVKRDRTTRIYNDLTADPERYEGQITG
ncbi:MAG: succinate--CoA ligase subunit beta, partial [Chloroflexi bacterium]|nr:succinate--CoA ligase subunit beta [Chloroflexota bacterium]